MGDRILCRHLAPTSIVVINLSACRKRVEPDFEGFKQPDTVPHFAFPLRDRFLQEGIGFKLTASVDGKPPPTVG